MRYHFLNADLSKNCDTATSEMSKSRDIQGRVSCVMCDVLIRFVVVWNYRGHSPSPHLPASQVSTMFVRFVSHVQLARVSIGDTFFFAAERLPRNHNGQPQVLRVASPAKCHTHHEQ